MSRGTHRETLYSRLQRAFLHTLFAMLLLTAAPQTLAAEGTVNVEGRVFVSEEAGGYGFFEAAEAAKEDSFYGVFFLSGSVADTGLRDGVPSFVVEDGGLNLYYNHTDKLLAAGEDDWHLVHEKEDELNGTPLEEEIGMGMILLQTSHDRLNWSTREIWFNAFSETPVRTEPMAATTDIELRNGCFYRLIVLYRLEQRTEEGSFLFLNTDKHAVRQITEVYEFHAAAADSEALTADPQERYSLGTRVRAKEFEGYAGEEPIEEKDPHYGWDLGHFFVSGHTDEVTEADGTVVFLKNVGDEVKLSFHLAQDIDALNGDPKLSVTADPEGFDAAFETPRTSLGRGALYVRSTDYQNVTHEPQIYTNFLEANTTLAADTVVELFEEGDYEVALDYQITHDRLIDTVGHYRIAFRFKVRNGNCMVFPFDAVTGEELSDRDMTENGFSLDLARSRYLSINLRREVLKESGDGLVEDTRFNGPARDGAVYTDEGIYTITVYNRYTEQTTDKKIYVGTNPMLQTHMVTGLSLAEIQDLAAQGAALDENGNYVLPEPDPAPVAPSDSPENGEEEEREKTGGGTVQQEGSGMMVPVGIGMIAAVGAVAVVTKRKSKAQRTAPPTPAKPPMSEEEEKV